MRITKYIVSTLSFLLLTMTSCDLDVKMYDGVIAEDLKPRNIEQVSQGSYRLLKNDNGLIDGGYFFWNYGADDLAWNGSSTGGTFPIYNYTRNVESFQTEYTWELGYRTIGNCNLVIEMGEVLGSSIPLEIKHIKGENHYLRALCYFLLVNEFAQPYSNNPTQNPGLPLKLTSDGEPANLPRSRSTVAEIYEQIEKDLIKAIDDMTLSSGVKPKANIYATKEAAQALLARVYLYMGADYLDKAHEMADNVIKSKRFELEKGERYATYPQHIPEDNKETIFAVRRTALRDKQDSDRPGGLYIKIDNNGWEEISASSQYLELLELHLKSDGMPQDLRSRFITKRFVEDGVANYDIDFDPEKVYENWWFAYARKQAGSNPHYDYGKIKVTKNPDGTFSITDPAEAAKYENPTIQSEPYNLGKRYFVKEVAGTKFVGRVEPEVFDAGTKVGKDSRFLVYSINKASYQEQRQHLWSPVISRLSEMYLIRAEVNAVKGNTQLALDDVNELRKRAGITEWTIANMATAEAGQPKDVKKIVEEERMLELAWEGHRRFDVFRNKQTLNRKYPGGHTMGSAADRFLEVPYNSPAVCEFIPQAQYDAYPYELEQNP